MYKVNLLDMDQRADLIQKPPEIAKFFYQHLYGRFTRADRRRRRSKDGPYEVNAVAPKVLPKDNKGQRKT